MQTRKRGEQNRKRSKIEAKQKRGGEKEGTRFFRTTYERPCTRIEMKQPVTTDYKVTGTGNT